MRFGVYLLKKTIMQFVNMSINNRLMYLTLQRANIMSSPVWNTGWCLLIIIFIIPTDIISETASEAYTKGEYQRAEQLYKEEMKTSSAPGFIWYNRGNCFMRLKETSKAIACWENALTELLCFKPALYNLASIYFKEKDYPAALVKLDMALESDPDNFKFLLMKFFCLKELDTDGEALITLEKTVDADTSFNDGWFLFAEYEDNLFDYNAAIEALNNYSDIGKRRAEKYYNLSILYEKIDMYDEAIYCLKRAESFGFNASNIKDSEKRIFNKMGLKHLAEK